MALLTASLAAGGLAIALSSDPDDEVILATTTSVYDSGLLDVLGPMFTERSGYRLKPVSVGTGAALEMAARGEADVVLVHAPEAERAWMAQGYGTERLLVMYNDFVIVGPPDDPAGVRGEPSVLVALERIATTEAAWVSRDDGSGTAQIEERLWREAGIDPAGQPGRIVSGQGMGGTLRLADHRRAYTLADRGTYLAHRATLELEILVEGDRRLLNLYHVMLVNPAAFPGVEINHEGAEAFARFLVSDEIQRVIGEYGLATHGQPLFIPAAGKTEDELLR